MANEDEEKKQKKSGDSAGNDSTATSVESITEKDLIGRSVDKADADKEVRDVSLQIRSEQSSQFESNGVRRVGLASSSALLGDQASEGGAGTGTEAADKTAAFKQLLNHHLSWLKARRENSDAATVPISTPTSTPGERSEDQPKAKASEGAKAVELLAAKKDVEGLKELALKATDLKTATAAVTELHGLSPTNVVEILRDLAKSDSFAVSAAMKHLVIESESAQDIALVAERWNNGELMTLWKAGKIDPANIIIALEYAKLDDKGAIEAMKALEQHPELKRELCMKLVEKNPFFKWFELEVEPKTRIEALKHLVQLDGPAASKALLDMTSEKDKELREYATEELNKLWTRDTKVGEGQPSISELLQGTRLQDFAKDLMQLKWPDSPNARATYRTWERAEAAFHTEKVGLLADITDKLGGDLAPEEIMSKFDDNWQNDRAMEDALKADPELLERYKSLRQDEKAVDAARSEVDKIVRAREEALRPYVEKYARELGIPVPEFRLSSTLEDRTSGIYRPGYGQIELKEKLAMSFGGPDALAVNVLFHELTHAEQDSLIIKRLADSMKAGKNLDAAQREQLKRQYYAETNGNTVPAERAEFDQKAERSLTDTWLDKVLEQRDGKPLSAAESLRADLLITAKREKAELLAEKLENDGTLRRLERRERTLKEGTETPLMFTLGAEPENREERAKRLLEVTELRPAIKEALQNLANAEKAGLPKDELIALEQTVKKELRDGMIIQITRLGARNAKIYLDRMHELESHEVGRRAGFFAEQAYPEAALEAAAVSDVIADLNAKGGPHTAEGKALLRALDPTGTKNYKAVWNDLDSRLGKSDATKVVDLAAQLILDHKFSPDQAKAFADLVSTRGRGLEKLATSGMSRAAIDNLAIVFAQSQSVAAEMKRLGATNHGEQGGFYGQRQMYLGLEKTLKPGNSLYDAGWRLLPAGDTSAADKSKVDLVLVNVNDGRWLPLDVKQHSDNKTGFFSKYNLRELGTVRGGTFQPDTAKLDAWLTDYIEKKESQAFDIGELPPPDLSEQPEAKSAREAREAHRQALEAHKQLVEQRLNEARAKYNPQSPEYEKAEADLKAINDLLFCNDDARKHMQQEARFADSAISSLSEFLARNAEHFKKGAGPVSVAPADVPPQARAAAEDMVRIDGAKLTLIAEAPKDGAKPEEDGNRTRFKPGNLPDLVNQAIDKLNLPQADKDAIRKNLGALALDKTKASPAEAQLIAQLEAVLRDGFSKNADGLEKLKSIVQNFRAEENRARAAQSADSMPDAASIERALRDADTAMDRKRFKIDSKLGVLEDSNGNKSLTDLWNDFKALPDGPDKEKARKHLNDALNKSPHLAEAMVKAIQSGDSTSSFNNLLTDKKYGVEKVIASSVVELDKSGTVEPGKPQIRYETRGSSTFTAADIASFSYNGGKAEIQLKDGTKIPMSSITRAVVTVAGTTDAVTIGRELMVGSVQAAHELTLLARANLGTPDKPKGGYTAEQRAEIDRRTMEEFHGLIGASAEAVHQNERAMLSREMASMWEQAFGTAFPEDLKSLSAADRDNMTMIIEDAANAIAKNKAVSPEEKLRVGAIAERWIQQLASPEAVGFDHVPQLPGQSSTDVLFRPSTKLSANEAAQIGRELARYGPNQLGDQAVIDRFSQMMLEQTRNWSIDLKAEHERRNALAKEVKSADLLVRATAVSEARLKLGPSAPADDVRMYAEKLLSGEIPTPKDGSLDLAKRHYGEVREAHAAASAKLEQVTRARAAELQTAAKKFCRENGIPEIKINVVEHLSGARASYEPGTGILNIPRSDLLDRAGGIRAINGVYHELVHTQQDALILRSLADDLKIKHAKANDQNYQKLAAAYKEATGRDLTRFDTKDEQVGRKFVDQVLRQRRPDGTAEPEALTPIQREKAIELAKAFKGAVPFSAIDIQLANAQRVASAERDALAAAASAHPSEDLLRRLADPANKQLAESLFGTSDRTKWSESVRNLVAAWEAAPKGNDGLATNWNERSAQATLQAELEERVSGLSKERQQNHDRYISSFAEKEAHLFGTGIERSTRREYIEAIHATPSTPEQLRTNAGDLESGRETARKAGLGLSDSRVVSDFVNSLSTELANWRDNLSAAWEHGNAQRDRMQQAFERSLAVAKKHAEANGKTGVEAEQEARHILDTPTEAALRDKAFTDARNEYLRAKSEYYTDNAAVHDALSNRQAQLQTAMDKFCSEHGLPKVKLQMADVASAASGYNRGAGVVTVNPRQLLERGGAQTLFSDLAKQAVHAQQDSHVVASLIDRYKGASGPIQPGTPLTPEQRISIKAEYEKATGSTLTDAFLEQVRGERKAPLSAEQIAHADKVAASFKESKAFATNYENTVKDKVALEREFAALGTGAENRPASRLLERLNAPGGDALCRRLFGVNNLSELPADHPVRLLAEQYKEVSVGGLRPGDSSKWSERAAITTLSGTITARQRELQASIDGMAETYSKSQHAAEGAALASDVQRETAERTAELERARQGDGQGLDLIDAQKRIAETQNQQKFLDLLSAKIKDLHPGTDPANLSPEKVKQAMEAVNRELRLSLTGFDSYGTKMTADQARAVAESGANMITEFSRGTADAKSTEVVQRVRGHIAPEVVGATARTSELPYDAWPPARDLAKLAEGRMVAESTESGIRLRRESAGEEWSADKLPTEEQVKRYVEERIKEMREQIEQKTKRGETVKAEERALLASLEKTHEMLKTDPKAYEGMRSSLKTAFGRTRAVAGSAVAVGIIVSAALGYYIKFTHGGNSAPGVPALDLPKA